MSVRLTPYLASAKQPLTLKIKNKTKKYEAVFSIGHKIPICSKYFLILHYEYLINEVQISAYAPNKKNLGGCSQTTNDCLNFLGNKKI